MLIFRTFVWNFSASAAYKLDRLTVPMLGEIKGYSSWNFEGKFWTELEESVTEICRNKVLMPREAIEK